jgi:EmrB/QacA subfamily drug resistance transporter
MTTAQNLRRPFVLAAVMAGMFMIAIEATIVSTAMPQIAGQLGDLHYYSWVFSAFLLAQTATTVVFGKLADLYGRKPVLLAGIAIFLVGSVLCGLAWSMPVLIAFRLIQGIGAGAIQPICITVVGDLYSIQERGKIQGYLASVWGVSSVIGPLAGGLIIQQASWAWIFWINLPIGIGAAAGFIAFLREDVAQEGRSVDAAGAALFAVAVASLMIGLTEIGTSHSTTIAAAAVTCVISIALFVLQERRARDPMIVFALWARRSIATANAVTLLSGMAVIGLTTFLPMYVQGVLDRSALVAGFALTVMVLGWPIGATVAARNVSRLGLRRTMLLGAALLPTGALAFLALGPGSSPVLAGVGSLVMGLGMGFVSNAAIMIIQNSAAWAERGSATASNVFSRNLGSTLGAAILGAVLNTSLTHGQSNGGAVNSDQIKQLLDHTCGAAAEASIRLALDQSLHVTFWAIFVVAAATLLLSTLVPAVSLAQQKVPGE